jgi:hypothetical protein
VVEARKYSALAVDTLVELTKDNHADSTRYNAATALLDRGYGRPAQSLDLHLSADAITKRLSDMTDAELATLEQRMIAAAPIVLEATAEVADDAGDVEDSPPDALPDPALAQNSVRGLARCQSQYSTRHGPSLSQTRATSQVTAT